MNKEIIKSLERECEILSMLLEEINDEHQESVIRSQLVQLSKYINKIDKIVNI